ncbi:MAG: hypothetical protein F6J87_13030 [Spirulina sp. SIO3F2]|nr:hypothetical protein [Spirulina sp. SIO3F2]
MGRWVLLIFLMGAIAACTSSETVEADNASDSTEHSTTAKPTQQQGSLPTAPVNSTTTVPKLSVDQSPWKTINGNGVRLDVPGAYEGGNPSTEYDALVTKLQAIDPKYAQRLEAIADNPEVSALLAFDMQDRDSDFLTSVNIATEAIAANVTLEDYVQTASRQLAKAYDIQSQSVIPVGSYRAGQIVGTIENNNTLFKQLFYMIPHQGRMWIVTYSTGAEAFETRLNEFTQSIQTIQLAP